MRPLHPVFALALLPGLVSAAPVPKAFKKPNDKTALVGAWTVTDLTVSSRKVDISYKTFTFTFDADGKVTLRHVNDTTGSWTWTIDTAVSPRRMQWTSLPKNEWDLVYELDGDSLKVGFISKGAKTPTAVEPCDGLTLYIMTRDTSAK